MPQRSFLRKHWRAEGVLFYCLEAIFDCPVVEIFTSFIQAIDLILERGKLAGVLQVQQMLAKRKESSFPRWTITFQGVFSLPFFFSFPPKY